MIQVSQTKLTDFAADQLFVLRDTETAWLTDRMTNRTLETTQVCEVEQKSTLLHHTDRPARQL